MNNYYSIPFGFPQGRQSSLGWARPYYSVLGQANEESANYALLSPEEAQEAERIRAAGNSPCSGVEGRTQEADYLMHWNAEECQKFYDFAKKLSKITDQREALKVLYDDRLFAKSAFASLSENDFPVLEENVFYKMFQTPFTGFGLGGCEQNAEYMASAPQNPDIYFKQSMYMAANDCTAFLAFANQLSLAAKQVQGGNLAQARRRISIALNSAYKQMGWIDFLNAVENAKNVIDRLNIRKQAAEEARNGDADAAAWIAQTVSRRKEQLEAEYQKAKSTAEEYNQSRQAAEARCENEFLKARDKVNKCLSPENPLVKAFDYHYNYTSKATGFCSAQGLIDQAATVTCEISRYRYLIYGGVAVAGLATMAFVFRPYMKFFTGQ